MRPELLTLFRLFRRPSFLIPLLTFFIQWALFGDLSRFGNSIFFPMIHTGWSHWIGNIIPLIFLMFPFENRYGIFRTWGFVIFVLFMSRLAFELPGAPPVTPVIQILGLSALVSGLSGYWIFEPKRDLIRLSARVFTLLLLISSIRSPDVYTQWGHAAGFSAGLFFQMFFQMRTRLQIKSAGAKVEGSHPR